MPDKFGFDELLNWGNIEVRCIEIGCKEGGPIWKWPEIKRMGHFMTHHPVGFNNSSTGETREDICRTCGNTFEQERKRGRPRVVCYICKPETEE